MTTGAPEPADRPTNGEAVGAEIAAASALASVVARLVESEIENVLTAPSPRDAEPAGDYAAAMELTTRRMTGDQKYGVGVIIEMTALASEAVIRLAKERGEDPRATLAWIKSTEWTG